MIILTNIVITLAIIGVVSFLGLSVAVEEPVFPKAVRVLIIGMAGSILGLILCLIAYVWMR